MAHPTDDPRSHEPRRDGPFHSSRWPPCHCFQGGSARAVASVPPARFSLIAFIGLRGMVVRLEYVCRVQKNAVVLLTCIGIASRPSSDLPRFWKHTLTPAPGTCTGRRTVAPSNATGGVTIRRNDRNTCLMRGTRKKAGNVTQCSGEYQLLQARQNAFLKEAQDQARFSALARQARMPRHSRATGPG